MKVQKKFHTCGDNHNNTKCALYSLGKQKTKGKSSWLLSRVTHLTLKNTRAVSQDGNWLARLQFCLSQETELLRLFKSGNTYLKKPLSINWCQQKLHSWDRYWGPGSGLPKLDVNCYMWLNCSSIDLRLHNMDTIRAIQAMASRWDRSCIAELKVLFESGTWTYGSVMFESGNIHPG